MQELNHSNFSSMTSEGVAIVNVGASWCPDCKRIEPIMTALENEYKDRIRFFKVNFDTEEQLKDSLQIRRIPTLIFYKNGKEVAERLVEPKSQAEIEKVVQQVL
ncbi:MULTISPECIES: thioredoxin family protein [Helicobacter]|uniref:Thioredoxin n=2 Tax=Helicobacter bilis TaxID=37372 RepID=C3XE60_9HELI|nr:MULTISPECIES: thioredoxin family protein [Helicobacter]AQQ59785.1 thioredoxin [Helicobacter bilis]EEO23299.1 hypothetical protein HRAG_00356 [Helicobacter bilis ATCC 43879]MDY5951685.1 thioredoxin family protein [Helicobacter sp.]